MELSIKNYKNILPKDLIKRAGKCSVREYLYENKESVRNKKLLLAIQTECS
jgi:hypothetical protein